MRTVRPEHRQRFAELREVRAAAVKHALEARELSKRRAEMIDDLVELGYSQADVARELGVSRQSIQKMLAAR
ncbi:hypothetical protein GCM10009840_32180 [Pseudolysinimonas kribbensis]|uniref:HTH cro/C1-type domain-containing protein n=1 Tax=Pseudolysinimonas kribbensis TaxID=433641 RepID=A0ABQ6JYB5_9MICO|nr:helix-turn-helix domain-containing protein [Pseudolysinimonas kribbensis]GMA93312.1 hypothetical protein GCM10025881_01360 [Pseudolysinimonas kribbensis]